MMGCVQTVCEDGALSGDESDVDCGGAECAPCAIGATWQEDGDCEGGAACDGTTCVQTFAVGVSVTGLALLDSMVLQNNGGDDLTVTGDGSFTFATRVTGAYDVTQHRCRLQLLPPRQLGQEPVLARHPGRQRRLSLNQDNLRAVVEMAYADGDTTSWAPVSAARFATPPKLNGHSVYLQTERIQLTVNQLLRARMMTVRGTNSALGEKPEGG